MTAKEFILKPENAKLPITEIVEKYAELKVKEERRKTNNIFEAIRVDYANVENEKILYESDIEETVLNDNLRNTLVKFYLERIKEEN